MRTFPAWKAEPTKLVWFIEARKHNTNESYIYLVNTSLTSTLMPHEPPCVPRIGTDLAAYRVPRLVGPSIVVPPIQSMCSRERILCGYLRSVHIPMCVPGKQVVDLVVVHKLLFTTAPTNMLPEFVPAVTLCDPSTMAQSSQSGSQSFVTNTTITLTCCTKSSVSGQ